MSKINFLKKDYHLALFNFTSEQIDRDAVNKELDYLEKPYSIYDMVKNGTIFNFDEHSIPTHEQIKECVEARAIERFGENFSFRNHQVDSIVSIILSFFNDKDNFVMEAPTGSGKSIIALLVADVLQYYFGLRGYILISDLSLLDQYKYDVDTYFSDFAFLKGQDNYTCTENGLTYPFGVCKLNGLKYSEIDDLPCAQTCPYITERNKAIKSPVVLMTYQAWLIQRNYIPLLYSSKDFGHALNYPFKQREFTICDEAHKLAEIIQDHFTPIINKDDCNKFADIISKSSKYTPLAKMSGSINPLYYKDTIDKFFNYDDNVKLLDCLQEFYGKIHIFGEICMAIKEAIGKKDPINVKKADVILMKESDWAREYCCKVEDYINMIKETGVWALVKNPQSEDTIKFNCIDERFLIREHFHKRCGNRLYMSATIGEPINYVNSISSDNNRYINIPSSFDFTKSPIYYDNEYKLSYDKKQETLPKIIKKTINIINKHSDVRGIIQTGSYAFALSLYNALPESLKDRVLMYMDSKDKEMQLEEFKKSTNKIIIGPSLLEGIDLKDDLCRFIVVMKIPYPSLGDKFIERKFRSNPLWYMWKTSNSLIQGIGRGVRNEKDWCETYILDGTLDNILIRHRNLIPEHVINRFVNVKF